MATATKQDDDLLIITDEDTNSDTSGEIEFSFDFGDDSSAPTKETTTPEAAIEKADLKVEDSVMATPDISLSDEAVVTDEVTVPDTIPAKEELLDISFDISDTPADTVVDMTAKQDTPSEDVSFDLTGEDTDASSKLAVGAMSIKTAKSVVSPTETPEVAEAASESSMNEILSTTIAKLASRQEVIASSKAGKATKEEEIKAQIKELQAQVSELEADMKELDKESDKITANIKELENMKLNPVKEHNSRRVTKK